MMAALNDTARHRGGKQLIPAPVGYGREIGEKVAFLELTPGELDQARKDLSERHDKGAHT
jgi:hypothetical protein